MTNEIEHCSRQGADRWRAFAAAFLGWMLDGYDFTVLTLILIDIQRDLSIDNAAAGALGTVALLTRLVGGIVAGAAADRWGRKLPMMVSILWFSLFAFLSGFSDSYGMLFCLRALFGLGMGGEWAAGMPLVLEHWPAHSRNLTSGVLQGAFSWGFTLAAVVFHYGYPQFEAESSLGWRAMLWSGIAPALLVLWIRRRVPESPLWLAHRATITKTGFSGGRLWPDELRGRVLRARKWTCLSRGCRHWRRGPLRSRIIAGRIWSLRHAMTLCISIAGGLAVVVVWLGHEGQPDGRPTD